jgi:hypothetical protein
MVRYYQLNHTYRLNSNPCSSHYLKAITIMQGKAVEVLLDSVLRPKGKLLTRNKP